MKGYTTPTKVALYLNRAFTADQVTLCNDIIEAVEELIDEETGVAFKPGVEQTDEFYQPGPLITVYNPPIDITQPYHVFARSNFTADQVELQEGLQFSLRDAEIGQFYIAFLDINALINPMYYAMYERIQIKYWTYDTVPFRVNLAANIAVSHYMRPALNDEIAGLARYSNGELMIMYSTAVMEGGLPAEATRLLQNIGHKFGIA